MFKRLMLSGAIVLTPIAAAAADPAAAPGPAGDGTTWAFLKTPLPGAPASCPDAAPVSAGLVKAPLFAERSGTCPVASIGDDVVTLDDLAGALGTVHEGRADAAKAGKQDTSAILNRVIDARLLLGEARAMGVDEMPEVVEGMKTIDERVGREMLKEQVLRDVRPDPAEVDRLYKDAVREWQIRSVLFLREADAKAMAKQIKAGKTFDALAAKAVADKTAKGNEKGGFVGAPQLLPIVLANVQALKTGQTSPPVKVPGGYAIIEVEAVRYPDVPKARFEAEQKSLALQKQAALKKYYEGLVKKYARIDEKLLKKLDFEAKKPGFAALQKDTRVLARVEGYPPITVGELTRKLGEQFYHGVDNATQQKRLNKAKGTTLDAIISVPVVAAEVQKLGIARTAEFRRRVEAEGNSLVFSTFVNKVVLPGVKLDQAAVQKYYDEHKADYMYPAFYKLEAIGFASQKDAEAAVAKLRAGTDFKWLNANAEGKLAEGKDSLRPGSVVSAKAVTPEFARAIDGARNGDYRVYAASPEQFYAVRLVEVVPPAAQPFEEVRDGITTKLYGEAVQASINDWVAKLRKVHPVQIYLTRIGG